LISARSESSLNRPTSFVADVRGQRVHKERLVGVERREVDPHTRAANDLLERELHELSLAAVVRRRQPLGLDVQGHEIKGQGRPPHTDRTAAVIKALY